ncbi:DUF6415 family natural product biosynthesis protein [Streptomyces antibioticus]|uniref:DUF6415 family natural product biosynthesis protein n=1 Tax=Streptomyces antibioticus TaxID=1890 RepID=UPI0036FC62CA
MRRPLASGGGTHQRLAANTQSCMGAGPGSPRHRAVAAAETVALVLGPESPLPESADDVEELAWLLRGHIGQLGALVTPEASALHSAQKLASEAVPGGYMPSRVHLVRLAEATRDLIAAVEAHDMASVKPTMRPRWRKPRINVLRAVVFVVAFACVILAASVPRT